MYAIIRLLRSIDPDGIHFGDHWDFLSDAHTMSLRQFIVNRDGKGADLLAHQLDFVLHEGVEHEDFYLNPRDCARDAYLHGQVAIWILEMNCVDIDMVLSSANLTSGQLIQGICSRLKVQEKHVSGRPASALEELRAVEILGVIENARAALLYLNADHITAQRRRVAAQAATGAASAVTEPIQYLNGWTEITDDLGVPGDEDRVRWLRQLSDKSDGPLHGFGKGSKPQLIDKAKLVVWWNSLTDRNERMSEQREQQKLNRDAAVSNTLDYGRGGQRHAGSCWPTGEEIETNSKAISKRRKFHEVNKTSQYIAKPQ